MQLSLSRVQNAAQRHIMIAVIRRCRSMNIQRLPVARMERLLIRCGRIA